MRGLLLCAAVALTGLVLPGAARASDYGRHGYGSGYGGGHYHYQPGHFDRHGSHSHYQPGHFDYHRRDYSPGYAGSYVPAYGGYSRDYYPSYAPSHGGYYRDRGYSSPGYGGYYSRPGCDY